MLTIWWILTADRPPVDSIELVEDIEALVVSIQSIVIDATRRILDKISQDRRMRRLVVDGISTLRWDWICTINVDRSGGHILWVGKQLRIAFKGKMYLVDALAMA